MNEMYFLEKHENGIRCQYNQLLNNLTSVPDIVAHMYQRQKLSAKELEHFQQFRATPIRASEELLNIIIGKSSDVYQCFLESLQKTRQHHVYQMLLSDHKNGTTGELLYLQTCCTLKSVGSHLKEQLLGAFS